MLKEEEIQLVIDILNRVDLYYDKELNLLKKLELYNERIEAVHKIQEIDSNLDKLEDPIEK